MKYTKEELEKTKELIKRNVKKMTNEESIKFEKAKKEE